MPAQLDNKEVIRVGNLLSDLSRHEGWKVYEELVKAQAAEIAHGLAEGISGAPADSPEQSKPEWWQGRYRGLKDALELMAQIVENAQMVAERVQRGNKVIGVRLGLGLGGRLSSE